MATRGILGVLRLLWENADRLLLLLERLPRTLRASGEALESAGQGAALVATTLDGGPEGGAGAATALREATAALEQVRRQVESIAQNVRQGADAMDRFTVPTVTATRQKINLKAVGLGEPEFVTGLNIGESRPAIVGDITGRIRSQADLLDTRLSEDLRAATEKLERLSHSLLESGERMRGLGESLKRSGAALRELEF